MLEWSCPGVPTGLRVVIGPRSPHALGGAFEWPFTVWVLRPCRNTEIYSSAAASHTVRYKMYKPQIPGGLLVNSICGKASMFAHFSSACLDYMTAGCLQSANSWTQFRNVVKSRVKSRDCVVTGGRVNSDASRTTRPVVQVPTGASWPLQGGRDACKRTGHQGR